MRFAVAAPGAALAPPARTSTPAIPLAPLGKLWKNWSGPGIYEVVKAVTADGEWLFERADDGTWNTGHLPTETVVKTGLKTLTACRRYAGSGGARADLNALLAKNGESR